MMPPVQYDRAPADDGAFLQQAAMHDAQAMFLQMGQQAPPQQWRQDEIPGLDGNQGALRGEMTADGHHMVLWTTGHAYDQKVIAQRLHLLTASGESAYDDNGQPTGARYYPLSWATIVQLGFIFNSGPALIWQPWPKLAAWIIAETIRRSSAPPAIAPCWPGKFTPRSYQLDGAAAIASSGKYLLGDEMGTGKTVTTLLGIEARRRAGVSIFPMVIVVPSWVVADVWERHIRDWMPHWPEPVLHQGSKRARIQGWKGRDYILITTYATLRRDAKDMRDLLVKIKAQAVIADECHMARNPRAKQSKALWRVAHYAPTLVWASGTLVTHDFGDIYQPLFTMAPLDWPSKDGLKARYLATRRSDYDELILGLRPEMEREFFAALLGQLRRIAKDDVLDELPDKIYSVLRPVIPPEWRHAYDTMEKQMLAELPDGGELPVMSVLDQLTRLSQLASSAADVREEYELDERTGLLKPHYHVTLKPPCWKAEALMEILAERGGKPTAVFAESRQLAMIAGQYCHEAGLRTGYVVGPGDSGPYGEPGVMVSDRSRLNAVDDFQAGLLDVIICTAGAGGLGITLTAADCVVMMQRSWQLDLALQPEDRAHRIGQKAAAVQIIDLVTRHTVDQRRREVLRDKAGQASQLYRDVRYVRALLGGLN